jgi:hypothetical protein
MVELESAAVLTMHLGSGEGQRVGIEHAENGISYDHADW